MDRLSTVTKVFMGFALMTLLLLAAVGMTIWQVQQMQVTTQQLVNQSAPMVEASLRIINGVSDATGKARGWSMLKDENLQAGWNAAFTDWMEPGLQNLKRLMENAGSEKQRDQIALVEAKMQELKVYQAKQIAISRSDDQFPALQLYREEAAPKIDEMLSISGALIEAKRPEQDSPTTKTLSNLADFRYTLSRAVTSILDYLTTGNDAARIKAQQFMAENASVLNALAAATDQFPGTQAGQFVKLKALRPELDPIVEKAFEIRKSDNWDQAVVILRDNSAPLARDIQSTLQSFIADLQLRSKADRESLINQTRSLAAMEWTLLGIGIVFSVLVTITIVRAIREAIRTVQEATQEVRTSSGEIAAGSQQQVSSLNQTATSLNQITTTAEEFKVTMQEFSDRARAVLDAAAETSKQSSEGRILTQDSAGRIEQLRENSEATGESVLRLAEQMQRIGEITATVNEIADQTKLLALNASIEAARAGEEGRGFAVVATQVRELANQSKESAGRIEALIGSTQKSMQDVVAKIERGNRIAAESSEIVHQVTATFEDIARAIDQTTQAMSQINSGARQQEQGISELVSSITEIDSASKESLASAEQTQKAILSIERQLTRLTESMENF
jgi:methyl-accepting chemotaxis protein